MFAVPVFVFVLTMPPWRVAFQYSFTLRRPPFFDKVNHRREVTFRVYRGSEIGSREDFSVVEFREG